MNQATVADSSHLGGGGQPDDKEPTEVSLLGTAVTKSEHAGAEQRFFGRPKQPAPTADKTLYLAEQPLLPLVPG
jgi:hypothetical protein